MFNMELKVHVQWNHAHLGTFFAITKCKVILDLIHSETANFIQNSYILHKSPHTFLSRILRLHDIHLLSLSLIMLY